VTNEELQKQADEIKTLVDLRKEAPNEWCRNHAQSLIDIRKMNVIEHCENLLAEIRSTKI